MSQNTADLHQQQIERAAFRLDGAIFENCSLCGCRIDSERLIRCANGCGRLVCEGRDCRESKECRTCVDGPEEQSDEVQVAMAA